MANWWEQTRNFLVPGNSDAGASASDGLSATPSRPPWYVTWHVEMPQLRPAAWINHALQDIDHAATQRDLMRLAQALLGPQSFDLGVCYGFAENATGMVGSLLGLSKTFVLAGLYDAAHMPTWSAGPLRVIHLEAEVIALFAGPALKKAHDQRNELIREVGKAVIHPGELLGNAVEHYSQEYVYKWNRFQLLMRQTSLSGNFEAGRIFGGVLVEVVLLISTIGDAVKAAKFLAEIPELVRLAKGLKEFGGAAGRLLEDETGAVRLGRRLEEAKTGEAVPGVHAERSGTEGGSVGAMKLPRYEQAKHLQERSFPTSKGISSRAPRNGQEALNASVRVKTTSPRRVGIDYETNEFVIFDETHPGKGIYHGHVRSWDELEPEMQHALRKSGMTNNRGEILRGAEE